jgi:hypothetical protein
MMSAGLHHILAVRRTADLIRSAERARLARDGRVTTAQLRRSGLHLRRLGRRRVAGARVPASARTAER